MTRKDKKWLMAVLAVLAGLMAGARPEYVEPILGAALDALSLLVEAPPVEQVPLDHKPFAL